MTLYLKRDLSANNCCFVISDALGAEKYLAETPASGLLPRHRLVITDTAGSTVAQIRRLSLAAASAYGLRIGRRHLTLVILPAANGLNACFYGSNWRFAGSIAAKDFSIIDVDKTLIMEHRRHADHCELRIPDSRNELICVAASVCVDLINTVNSPAWQAV